MKSMKGITLIALVITIIVMLILVGVTITVAIQGGLFDTANTAKVGMTREVAREKLISAMVGAYDGNGNFVKGNVVLPEGMSWDTENPNCVITDNGEKFYIDANGTVLDEEPTGAIDKTKTYNISFKDLTKFNHEKWESIIEFRVKGYAMFYPANITMEEAAATNNYTMLILDSSSDGYFVMYDIGDEYVFSEADGTWFKNPNDENLELEQMITIQNVKIAEQSVLQNYGVNPLTDAQLNEILNIVEVSN